MLETTYAMTQCHIPGNLNFQVPIFYQKPRAAFMMVEGGSWFL